MAVLIKLKVNLGVFAWRSVRSRTAKWKPKSIPLPDGQNSPTNLNMSMSWYFEILSFNLWNIHYICISNSQGSSYQWDYKPLETIYQRNVILSSGFNRTQLQQGSTTFCCVLSQFCSSPNPSKSLGRTFLARSRLGQLKCNPGADWLLP